MLCQSVSSKVEVEKTYQTMADVLCGLITAMRLAAIDLMPGNFRRWLAEHDVAEARGLCGQ